VITGVEAPALNSWSLDMPGKKAPAVKNDDPSMIGQRARNEDGSLRAKRRDTRVDTIEDMYGRDFEVRGDMHLGTLLDQEGVGSLAELLKKK
jgi:hypothetical protein